MLVIDKCSHLLKLNSICHKQAHLSKVAKSSCKSLQSFIERIVVYRVIYHQHRAAAVQKIELGISFMYKRNNRGPKTVPCGTPERTGQETLCCPSSRTFCVLLHKKSLIHNEIISDIAFYEELGQKLWQSPKKCISVFIRIKTAQKVVCCYNELSFR